MPSQHADNRSAILYVDGFNLYRQLLQAHPHAKWLDLAAMADVLLPAFTVRRVRFFTARIRATAGSDPTAPVRQATYLRALQTQDRISIHEGTFRVDKRWMARHPVTLGADGIPLTVRVRKIEEKGSDVNLAAYMLFDAFRGECEATFLLSNDSDFADAFRLVRDGVGQKIGLISPTERPSRSLLNIKPDYVRQLRLGLVSKCQFPETLQDEHGTIRRPASWRSHS